MLKNSRARIIFITGTDTNVGKTLLTSLLLSHLRQTGSRALAIKPFCSGGRADAKLLHALQDGDLSLHETNPFHFSEPLAPLVAARKRKRPVLIESALAHVQTAVNLLLKPRRKSKIENPTLLIEGAGGLLVPLGQHFDLLDVILVVSSIQHPASSVEIIIVAPNRLGTINHTLLAAHRLRAANVSRFKAVLMDTNRGDASSRSNAGVLTELLAPNPVESIPFLGRQALQLTNIRTNSMRLADILARISQSAPL